MLSWKRLKREEVVVAKGKRGLQRGKGNFSIPIFTVKGVSIANRVALDNRLLNVHLEREKIDCVECRPTKSSFMGELLSACVYSETLIYMSMII